jgi:hypothetical protein
MSQEFPNRDSPTQGRPVAQSHPMQGLENAGNPKPFMVQWLEDGQHDFGK